jgi:predicted acyltransferase
MQRLLSIDILRGLTICLMILVNNPGSWSTVYNPLLHAKWHGCTLTDLVFPFFMFVVGLSMYHSIETTSSKGNPWLAKSLGRGLKLILIGLLLNWYPFFKTHFTDLRFFGVLQRIGISYILACVLLFLAQRRYLWIWASVAIVTIGYWVVLLIFGSGDYSLEGNLVTIVDAKLVGEPHMYKGFGIRFDPEGLLSSIPAAGNILLGYIMAHLMSRQKVNHENVMKLTFIGLACIAIGIVWNVVFPINKPLWTSSYVFYTCGLATVLWSALIYYIDVEKVTNGGYFLKVFGQNPIFAFVMSGIVVKTFDLIKVEGQGILGLTYSEFFKPIFGDYGGSLAYAISFVCLIWSMTYLLDKRGIYLKV